MAIKKLTPIINVSTIEPMLGFWQAIGFEVTTEVPHEDALGFVILAKDGVEVMYQSTASIVADVPALERAGTSEVFFIETDDLAAIEQALESHEVVVPKRTTFYGSTEVFYRAPCGTVVGFAQF